jgi:hypothetical protein
MIVMMSALLMQIFARFAHRASARILNQPYLIVDKAGYIK